MARSTTPPRSRHRSPWRLIASTLVIAALSAAGVALTSTASERPADDVEPRGDAVVIADVGATDGRQIRRLYGITRTPDRATIAPNLAGHVIERGVEIGDEVSEGDVLFRLDTRGYRNSERAAGAALRELDARAEQLDRDIARVARLVAASAATEQELEQLRAQRAALAANRDAVTVQQREARRLRRDGTVRAPFAGIVSEVLVREGEFVGPGTPLALLAGDEGIEIEVELPERLVTRVKTGDRAQIAFPIAGLAAREGTVVSVGNASSRPGRLFPAIIALDDTAGVLPGMTAEVELSVPSEVAVTVPVAAIVAPTGQRAQVFVVRDTKARRVDVDVLDVVDDRVAVRGELEPGEEVVVGGYVGLRDGETVEVAR